MFRTFADDQNPHRLAIPVIPNIGNNDFLPHNVLLPGPNQWLQHYTEIWRSFIPEEQRHSFEFGGWFSVEVIPNRLAVFSLNTMYFFDRNAAIDDCVNPVEPGYKQLEWLRIQLSILRSRGMKAILIGHVPPAKTDSKELWDGTCGQKYSLWLRQYRDVITGSIYGHMNIDHFVIHDTKEIDMDFIGGAAEEVSDESIDLDFGDDDDGDDDDENEGDDDEEDLEDVVEPKKKDLVSATSSKGKYLAELREAWAKLPPVKVLCQVEQEAETSDVEDQGKRRKGKGKGKKRKSKKQRKKQHLKKLGGRWAERYHVSLISSSVVPNYFPSLRVFEYNITGLEDVPRWSPPNEGLPSARQYTDEDADLVDLHQEIELAKAIRTASPGKGGNKKKGNKKKGKGNKPKDPSLVIPDPPSQTAIPGPAYSMQPLTLTGYTQYFSNLTDINNLPADSDPKRKKKPEAKEFNFEVQYSTFTDKVFKLTDLTVRNYVRLAFRMGLAAADEQKAKNPSRSVQDEPDEDDFEDEDDDDEGADSPDDDDVEEESELVECESIDGTALKKKDKKRRKKESDRAWRRFVKYAFVSTGVEETYNLVGARRDGDDE